MSDQPSNALPVPAPAPRKLAYLLSQYPMLSMIFVIREVLQLRAMGFQIDVASINSADRAPQGMTADELGEATKTHYVLAEGYGSALRAHAGTLLATPGAWLRGLALVFELGQFDLKRLAMNAIYLTEALMVGRWMQRVGQRHLHVHLGNNASTVGLYVKRVFGFGLSITIHGPDEFYDANGQYLTQKVVAADFIVCISHFAKSQLMKLSPYEHWPKLQVSRLGVDPAVFSPQTRKREEGQPFEVLCIGRLTPAKGQHLLIDAIKLLVDQGRAVRLRVVGAGVDMDSLQAQTRHLGLQAHVVFEGAVTQDGIRALYARADCFCIPSFAEGIPVVLMEAMAMGIPCVTTHITGIPELIRHGETGLLVAPGDVQGLAVQLARLMDEPQLCQALAVNGRQQVVQHYDLARNVAGLGALFSGRLETLR